ncbi:isochorismatase family protein [Allopusillimonas soli]|uniref:Isochorismatase family protein n=1 Tax=Allopusillimonas soli TaxID=659016 RepID=A0A853FCH2_9BURK|nr:isochorismatase family protein [Allopusillimonas soli]NYT37637.1 isochorismatase family protein [Allopusillimonas soli]TEA74400.1 isochorismatase family protein [Allopusillimonas soli]
MKDEANIRGGFDGTLVPGNRPALLVIDFQRGFTEAAVSPLASDCSSAIAATNRLIAAMRGLGPVIFTIVGYSANMADIGCWKQKCGALTTLERGTAACELDPRLDYAAQTDLILHKTQASAFFGTPLANILASSGCDMLVVAGATTSGCVRASVVDAMQYGFPPFVAHDCVADRSEAQHASNLIDMASKYGEVVSSEAMLKTLADIGAAQSVN